jgi:hypothetical protein
VVGLSGACRVQALVHVASVVSFIVLVEANVGVLRPCESSTRSNSNKTRVETTDLMLFDRQIKKLGKPNRSQTKREVPKKFISSLL